MISSVALYGSDTPSSSSSVPPLPLFELFLNSSLVTAVDDEDDDDYANEYDFAPDALLFIEFRNQFLQYQRVQ